MAREIRISPDGNSVAIRTDADPQEWNAWNVTHAINGSFWGFPMHVEDWEVLREGSTNE
jgi:hypothetical protein